MNFKPATLEELKNVKMIVYGILNKVTHKWYIGQTLRTFSKRYAGGFMRHPPNVHLERIYRKYNPEDFEVYILARDVESIEALDRKEEELIIQYNSIFPNGYNFEGGGQRYEKRINADSKRRMSETHLSNLAKKRIIVDPQGVEHVYYNPTIFAKEHGLDAKVLSNLMSGDNLVSYKGWHKLGVDPSKPLRTSKLRHLVGPDGKEYSFWDTRKFAVEHGLHQDCLYQVFSGVALSHRGFHLKDVRDRKPNTPIGNPNNNRRKYEQIRLEREGKIYTIMTDVIEFCNTHGITKREVYTLTSGEQKTARGFKLVDFTYTKQYLERIEKRK